MKYVLILRHEYMCNDNPYIFTWSNRRYTVCSLYTKANTGHLQKLSILISYSYCSNSLLICYQLGTNSIQRANASPFQFLLHLQFQFQFGFEVFVLFLYCCCCRCCIAAGWLKLTIRVKEEQDKKQNIGCGFIFNLGWMWALADECL